MRIIDLHIYTETLVLEPGGSDIARILRKLADLLDTGDFGSWDQLTCIVHDGTGQEVCRYHMIWERG